jgi:hypothetical protein
MNRSDLVTSIAYLEQVQAAIADRVSTLRETLAADARAEYQEQRTAPTWRIPDVATVSASVSRTAVVVDNAVTFARWVAERHPIGVEQTVRTEWQKAFLKRLRVVDGEVCDGEGEIVPGLTVRKGGEFRSISLTVEGQAKDLLAEMAGHTVAGMLAASDLPALRALEAGNVAA